MWINDVVTLVEGTDRFPAGTRGIVSALWAEGTVTIDVPLGVDDAPITDWTGLGDPRIVDVETATVPLVTVREESY